MAERVGLSPCPAISTPQRNDPLDADVVRGNDNTIRTAYNTHQADPGIHVQSSELSLRPVAAASGVGAKWINTDAAANAPRRLWYSDGTAWYEVSSSQAVIAGSAAAPGVAFSDDTDTGLFSLGFGNNVIGFATAGTERARINAVGAAKFSLDGTYVSAVGGAHELRTNGSGGAVTISSSNAAPAALIGGSFTAASPDNNTARFLTFNDSTTDRCIVYSDGDLANHDGVYGTISDERLKQDIVDATPQWDDIKAVQFRKYRMKTDVAADANAPYLLGVIAQEIEQTSPGLVEEQTNEDGTTTKIVKSSILLMKAAVALQEAMTRIEALEARVATLEAGA